MDIFSYTLSFKISVLMSSICWWSHCSLPGVSQEAIASISDTHSDPQHSPEREWLHAFSPPPLLPTHVWAIQSNSFLSGLQDFKVQTQPAQSIPSHSSLASVWKGEFLDQLVLHHVTGVSRDSISVALLKHLTRSSLSIGTLPSPLSPDLTQSGVRMRTSNPEAGGL